MFTEDFFCGGAQFTRSDEVLVSMPLALTPEMLRAVREHATTRADDREKMNERIGWLICAWDVLVEHRTSANT